MRVVLEMYDYKPNLGAYVRPMMPALIGTMVLIQARNPPRWHKTIGGPEGKLQCTGSLAIYISADISCQVRSAAEKVTGLCDNRRE